MGIFDKIFGKYKQAVNSRESLKMIDGYTPVFTSAPESIYEMELVRACIGQFATMCAKLRPVIKGVAYKDLRVTLETKPNPYMDTYKFIYKIATILAVNNTAFIVPIEDDKGYIVGYYPVLPTRCEPTVYKGTEYLIYKFANGKIGAIEFAKVGILTNHQYSSDIFGAKNRALNPTLQLMHIANQGMAQAVEQSARVRFIAKVGNNYKKEQIRQAQMEFKETNFSVENDSGLMVYDNRFIDVKQIDYKPWNLDERQQAQIKNNVFNYFGTNEKILQNSYTEDEWNAYYEGKIEPFAIQLSLVLSNMTFTPRELAYGNQIAFTSNRLQYASNNTKVSIATQLFDRGMLTTNQALEIFNMPPVEGGDKLYIRKEYAELGSTEGEEDASLQEQGL